MDVNDERKLYGHPKVEGQILVRPGQVALREAAGWEPVKGKITDQPRPPVATEEG